MFDQVGQGKAFKAVKGAFKYISWFQEKNSFRENGMMIKPCLFILTKTP